MALDSELRLNDLLGQVPLPGQDCFPLCRTDVATPFMECQLCGKPLVTCLMVLTHLTRAVILGEGFDSSNQHFTAPENPVTFPGPGETFSRVPLSVACQESRQLASEPLAIPIFCLLSHWTWPPLRAPRDWTRYTKDKRWALCAGPGTRTLHTVAHLILTIIP